MYLGLFLDFAFNLFSKSFVWKLDCVMENLYMHSLGLLRNLP